MIGDSVLASIGDRYGDQLCDRARAAGAGSSRSTPRSGGASRFGRAGAGASGRRRGLGRRGDHARQQLRRRRRRPSPPELGLLLDELEPLPVVLFTVTRFRPAGPGQLRPPAAATARQRAARRLAGRPRRPTAPSCSPVTACTSASRSAALGGDDPAALGSAPAERGRLPALDVHATTRWARSPGGVGSASGARTGSGSGSGSGPALDPGALGIRQRRRSGPGGDADDHAARRRATMRRPSTPTDPPPAPVNPTNPPQPARRSRPPSRRRAAVPTPRRPLTRERRRRERGWNARSGLTPWIGCSRPRRLSVEVGGRLVVESANFTVMPRDKVGIVGRNGAGKTSLFKVLGGETEPAAGRVVRKGGFGYLPAGPADRRRARRPHRRHPRAVRARHRRRDGAHREAAHRHGGAPRRAQRRALHAGPRSSSAPTAATPPTARRARWPPGSASARPASS